MFGEQWEKRSEIGRMFAGNSVKDVIPGVHHDLDNAKYHALPGLSNSGISDLLQSPYHYYSRHLDPGRPARDETQAQQDGTIAHCAILEPNEFDKRYRVGPDVSRATKAWKEAEEKARADGLTLIKPEQYDRALRQSAAVWMIPDAAEALSSGRPEVSAIWRDPETHVTCRCRPDWVHETGGGVILLDVKTYSDASPREFERQAARMAYHRQDAWYTDGYAIASGKPVLGFIFVAVEMPWPNAASASMFDDDARAAGRRQCREAVSIYSECLDTGRWPGYPAGIELIRLPSWAA
jgi:hypothetical protein